MSIDEDSEKDESDDETNEEDWTELEAILYFLELKNFMLILMVYFCLFLIHSKEFITQNWPIVEGWPKVNFAL